MAVEITDENIKEILTQNEIALVDFWAPWCAPCRMLGPIVEELATTNEGITIGKLNVDENSETAIKYGIRGIPTMLFFKNGEVVEKIVGVKSKAEIQAKLDSLKA